MINRRNVGRILEMLKEHMKRLSNPAVERVGRSDPFRVLISAVISARTKDNVTREAARRLFEVAKNPYDLLKLGESRISELIYPAGFYRNKAKSLIELSRTLIDSFGGKVPDDMNDLLSLRGVGRKVANLVMVLGFDKYGICVDTHVHRITNRWGFLETSTPFETEMMLRKILPKKYWKQINRVLVTFGKNICKPIGPLCGECPIEKYCEKRFAKKREKIDRLTEKFSSS